MADLDVNLLHLRAAYHGPGWRERRRSQSDDIEQGIIWSPFAVNSEFMRLKAVVLYRPGAEIENLNEPERHQHLLPIRSAPLATCFDEYERALAAEGVRVFHVENIPGLTPPPNLMYARDLFFNTTEGAVVARMASPVRAGEERFAALTLARVGVPLRMTVGGAGCFEGADALWLNPRHVVCGLGRRTNLLGFEQLKNHLKFSDLTVTPVPVADGVQHLLGLVQIVDHDLVLIRTEAADPEIPRLFAREGYRIIDVPESEEVRARQGFNLICTGPRRVIVAAGCPSLRELYLRNGIHIAAEVEIGELVKGAGGLACATGILSRAVR